MYKKMIQKVWFAAFVSLTAAGAFFLAACDNGLLPADFTDDHGDGFSRAVTAESAIPVNDRSFTREDFIRRAGERGFTREDFTRRSSGRNFSRGDFPRQTEGRSFNREDFTRWAEERGFSREDFARRTEGRERHEQRPAEERTRRTGERPRRVRG